MKTFSQFNTTGPACPICNTCDNKETVLIPIDGTNTRDDPRLFEARQVHLECLHLRINFTSMGTGGFLIYQIEDNKDENGN